jgi:regulator of replication initiation timing
MMNLDLVLRLEEKINQLLQQRQALLEECRRLKDENALHVSERDRVRGEIDRILAKLDAANSEAP